MHADMLMCVPRLVNAVCIDLYNIEYRDYPGLFLTSGVPRYNFIALVTICLLSYLLKRSFTLNKKKKISKCIIQNCSRHGPSIVWLFETDDFNAGPCIRSWVCSRQSSSGWITNRLTTASAFCYTMFVIKQATWWKMLLFEYRDCTRSSTAGACEIRNTKVAECFSYCIVHFCRTEAILLISDASILSGKG